MSGRPCEEAQIELEERKIPKNYWGHQREHFAENDILNNGLVSPDQDEENCGSDFAIIYFVTFVFIMSFMVCSSEPQLFLFRISISTNL